MGRLICITGKPKTGKTTSAATFPKPALLIDFGDRGSESFSTAKNSDGSLVVPDWKEITTIELYNPVRSKLDFKSYKLLKGGVPSGAPEYAEGALTILQRYEEVMDQLFVDATVTIDGVKYGPFQTLIIDPLTAMFRFWKAGILAINDTAEFRRGDYQTLEDNLFNRFLPNLKTLLDRIPWIILTDHEDFDQTEKGDVIAEYPVGPTKNMGKNLSEGLDELWRMEVINGRYRWRTQKHSLFVGAGSRLSLPDPIEPATFQALQKYLPKP